MYDRFTYITITVINIIIIIIAPNDSTVITSIVIEFALL